MIIVCEFIPWKLYPIQDSFQTPWNKILQYLELEAINLISIVSMKYKWSYYIAKKIIENNG